jgi:hypothetical protein
MNEENNNINNETNKEEEIEILDLGTPSETTGETLTSKKENHIIIIIAVIVAIIGIFFIPKIYNLINGRSNYVYSSESSDIKNNNTVDGFLEIGKDEGSITAKKIQFYSFMKKDNNVLSFKCMAETQISNVKDLNIYIELYNSKKNVIYRTKFNFYDSLDRKTIERVNITLNENIYGEATYAKVVILKDSSFAVLDNSLNCSYSDVNDIYTLNSNVVYNFSTNGLIEYKVTRKLIANPTYTPNEEDENDPLKIISKEGEMLSKDGARTIEYTDSDISYTVDLLTSAPEKALYNLGTTYRQIKLESENNKWRCE